MSREEEDTVPEGPPTRTTKREPRGTEPCRLFYGQYSDKGTKDVEDRPDRDGRHGGVHSRWGWIGPRGLEG